MTKAPERWFCKTNDPALKFLWYLFFENRSAFIRQVCLPHLKLRIKWLCRGSSPQRCVKTAFVINGKIKKFPSWKSPESLDDTAFDAVSSNLADHDGMPDRIRTCDLQSRSLTLYPAELRAHILFLSRYIITNYTPKVNSCFQFSFSML